MNLDHILENISKIKETIGKFLPHGQQSGIFSQLDSLASALQQNKADLESADPFRNRAHAAFTWSVEWIVIYNYFIRDVFVNVAQLFDKHIVITPVDNTTIITLVSLALFGKAIFNGLDLVDKIKQKATAVIQNIEEKANDNSTNTSKP